MDTIWVALMAGLLSFLSPCILPVAPGYLGMISGISATNLQERQFSKGKVFWATVSFVIGFTLVFVVMGLGSSILGQLLRGSRGVLSRVGGIVVIFLGLHQAGWLPLPWLYREYRLKMGQSVGLIEHFLPELLFP